MTEVPQSSPAVRLAARLIEPNTPTGAPNPVLPTSFAPKSAQNGRMRGARLRRRLTDRDLAVLGSLRQFRLLTGSQVERLHFGENSDKTSSRRARAVVRRLAELGVIVRFGRSIGGVRAGSSGHVLGLTGLGHSVLDVGQPDRRRPRHTWEGKPYFQEHTLAVAELHAAVVTRTRCSTAELLGYETEPASWRRFGGGSVLKPDYAVRLAVDDIELAAFAEIDLGTESVPSVVRKCQSYIQYWQTGTEQTAHDVFPVVLWLVPDDRRKARLQEGIARLPQDRNLSR